MWTRLVLVVAAVGLVFAPVPAAAQAVDGPVADRVASSIRQYAHYTVFDDVSVAVHDGCVTITGRVTDPYKQTDILARVRRVDGVRSVVDRIRVLPLSIYDSDLRARIAQAIYANPAFWQYAAMANPPIHIIVENGRVTLTGSVGSEVDRSLAFALSHVPGAFDVKNELRLGAG
jgi:osmotically-inducible protein OsmY